MDYQKAKELRKKSFSERMTENLLSGGGIRESFSKTLSEKSKARTMGIKEAFDPLNIAKKLTGGGRLGPALLGKMMGRSKADLEYFAGDPRKRKLSSLATTGLDSESLQASTESLGRIYELLKQDRDNKVEERNRKKSFEEILEEQEEQRNQELIKALTARRKKTPKEKRKEEVKQKETERKAKADNKKTENKENVEQKKTEVKKEPEAKKTESESKKTAEKAKKEEVKQTADKQKTEAKQKKVEEAPKAAPAPKPTEAKAPPTAAPAPKPTPTAPAVKPSVVGKLTGAAGLVVSSLVAAGLSPKAQANVLSQVKEESNFVPRSENLNYSSAKAIQNTFGKNRIPTEEFAQQFVKNPEALANHVYAKTDGNSDPGDGWKYRGRGFLQITGKNAYKSLGDYLKIDLVSNPDLLNNPEIAAKSIPWFFLKYKAYLTKGDPKALENISLVNKAVGFSDPTGEKAAKRTAIASEYEKKDLSIPVNSAITTGTEIDRASTENKNLKEETGKDKSPIIVNNNTTTVQKQASASKSAPVDDKPAYMKKVQQ